MALAFGRWRLLLLLPLLATTGCTATPAESTEQRAYITSPAVVDEAAYTPWAHSHWVWLSHSQGNRQALEDLVAGYLARNISVGAVNIDSEWSTGINNFIFDADKFPNASAMIEGFHDQGIRVVVWATSMVDTDSSNYKEGLENGYYVRSPLGLAGVLNWWHGDGSLLDYSNPDAVSWWHSQLDNVLDIGVDGFKCDGTDPYILELVLPMGHAGTLSYRDYANSYYNDFFDYANAKRGGEALIMARPVDSFSIIHFDFAPKRVMASGWVGDQDPTFDGLKIALQNYMYSAWARYANYGSDTGGYRSGSRTGELLLRWAQVNSFSPLFENGGEGDHQPWVYGENVSAIYRDFVDIHYGLQSYLLTHGSDALENGTSVIRPLADADSFVEKVADIFVLDTLCYLLGPDILVAPIYEPGGNAEVKVPPNSSWRYWFDSSLVVNASSTSGSYKLNFPINEFGAFRRIGSILPITTWSPYHSNTVGIDKQSLVADEITLVWDLDATNDEAITIRRWKRRGIHVSVTQCRTAGRCLSIRVSAADLMDLKLRLVYGSAQAPSLQARVQQPSSRFAAVPCQRVDDLGMFCEVHLGDNGLGHNVTIEW